MAHSNATAGRPFANPQVEGSVYDFKLTYSKINQPSHGETNSMNLSAEGNGWEVVSVNWVPYPKLKGLSSNPDVDMMAAILWRRRRS